VRSPRSWCRPIRRRRTSSRSRTSSSETVSWKTGQQFDASWDRGSTFKFGLGKGQVIAGWDQGVAGMRVGGRRRITIPPMLAYGKRGAGRAIGPDETLVFVVDLISVR